MGDGRSHLLLSDLIMMVDLLEHPDPKRILTQFGALVIMICLFGFVITASMLSIYQLSHL
jgi:hypothetical protein